MHSVKQITRDIYVYRHVIFLSNHCAKIWCCGYRSLLEPMGRWSAYLTESFSRGTPSAHHSTSVSSQSGQLIWPLHELWQTQNMKGIVLNEDARLICRAGIFDCFWNVFLGFEMLGFRWDLFMMCAALLRVRQQECRVSLGTIEKSCKTSREWAPYVFIQMRISWYIYGFGTGLLFDGCLQHAFRAMNVFGIGARKMSSFIYCALEGTVNPDDIRVTVSG